MARSIVATTHNYRPNLQTEALRSATRHLSKNAIKVGNIKKIWKSGIGTS